LNNEGEPVMECLEENKVLLRCLCPESARSICGIARKVFEYDMLDRSQGL
jgi:hypothetical protein